MAQRGRPKLPAGEKRAIARLILFNELENSMLTELAKENGVSMATIVRYGIAVLHNLHKESVSTALVGEYQ